MLDDGKKVDVESSDNLYSLFHPMNGLSSKTTVELVQERINLGTSDKI